MFNTQKFLLGAMMVGTLAACSTPMFSSNTVKLGATLYASAEVPPNDGKGSGTMEGSLNKDTNLLKWTVTYSGLSGAATMGHFHGPAVVGQNAPVAVPFTGSLASPIIGEATLTSAQVADLMAGKWYVNLHTAAHPGGEIRGQVVVR